MKIGKDQLRPIETPLVGFAGSNVYPLKAISLQITADALRPTVKWRSQIGLYSNRLRPDLRGQRVYGWKNYCQEPNKRNSFQANFWDISRHRDNYFRTTFHNKEENKGQLHLNLDLLNKAREKVAQRITSYQGQMARYYNTKVKLRRFEVGNWVLRKVTQATKDQSQGKLGPNWEGPYMVIQYYRRGTYHLDDMDGKKLPYPWNVENFKKYYP
uniref:Reverse transcriptase domain-containing protein n=1 Tax=Fagus sylvatica TaxID=28930 RepID=A0A2N9I9R7_FAGSY